MILADENVPETILAAIEAAGISVVRMSSIAPGADDDDVLREAVARDLVVLTQDKGFGDLVVQHGASHTGIVLVRLRGLPLAEKAQRIVAVLVGEGVALRGVLTVVSNRGIRRR